MIGKDLRCPRTNSWIRISRLEDTLATETGGDVGESRTVAMLAEMVGDAVTANVDVAVSVGRQDGGEAEYATERVSPRLPRATSSSARSNTIRTCSCSIRAPESEPTPTAGVDTLKTTRT